MNILLANMPIEFNRRESLEPPLGICYIAAMLRDLSGVNTVLKDTFQKLLVDLAQHYYYFCADGQV